MLTRNSKQLLKSSLSQVLSTFMIEARSQRISLEHSESFGQNKQYKVEIANSIETRQKAYELIYQLYRQPGIAYANFHPSEMWYSIYDLNPNTVTFYVKDHFSQLVVATLTVVIDSQVGLPLEVSYPSQIKSLRNNNRKSAEIVSLGFHESVRGNKDVLIQLFRYAYLYARGIQNVTDFLIMVSPKHSVFYQRKLMFNPIGDEISCEKINNKSVRLYHLNLELAEQECEASAKSGIKSKTIFNHFETVDNSSACIGRIRRKLKEMKADEMEYFFCEQKPLLENADAVKLQKITNMYASSFSREFLNKQILLKEFDSLVMA